MFGDYATAVAASPDAAAAPEQAPPRLFPDTFTYAARMIERLSRPEEQVFPSAPGISREERMIRMSIPEDMRTWTGLS